MILPTLRDSRMLSTMPGQSDGATRAESAGRRGAIVALMMAGFGLGALPVFFGLLNHDVAWLLHAAARVLDGERLYRDVVETNPPLIVWLNFAPIWLARAAGISDVLAFRLLVLVVVAFSLWLVGRVLRQTLPDRPAGRLAILLVSLFALLPLVGYDFGEREHLLFALVLPYLMLVAGRAAGVPMRGSTPWIVGIMAGLGIVLKPHFLLLWIGVEGSLAWAGRGWRPWLRPENLAIVALGTAYAIAAVAIAPDYLRLVGWAWPIYSVSVPITFLTMIDNLAVVVSLIAWFCYPMVRPAGPYRDLCRVVLIADLSFLGITFLQYKGFAYHYYPPMAAATLLLGLLFLESRVLVEGRARWTGALCGGLAAAVMILAAGDRVVESRIWGGRPIRSETPFGRLARLASEHAGGGSLFLFSPAVADSFPLVNYCGVGWSSRHPCLWFLAGLYAGPDGPTPAVGYRSLEAMGASERFLFETVVDDLLKDPPALLLVDEAMRPGVFHSQRFDYLAYYGRDPRFAAFLHDYEPMAKVGTFRPYRRKTVTLGRAEARH